MARKPTTDGQDLGPLAVLRSEGVGGRAARRMLPLAVLIPTVVVFFAYIGLRFGLYGPALGATIAVLIMASAGTAGALKTGRQLNDEEDARKKGEKKAQQVLKKATSELEALMNSRTQELQDEKMKAETLLECIGDGVFVIDHLWTIRSWNEAAETISGYTKADAIGKPFRDVVHFVRESDRKPNLAFIEECMLFGKTQYIENHTLMLRKDGGEVPVGDSAAPVLDKDGKVVGAIIVFRDVSKEYEIEASRQEFASLATHQLRTPITVITGYAELLADEKASLSELQQNALAGIEKAAVRLNALVTAMLNVTRVESGTIDIAPELCTLSDIADEVTREMAAPMEEHKLQLVREYEPDVPAVSVDVKLVGAIFRNLVSNAVKYTPEGGKITIRIARRDRFVVITIADTGYGIPKAQQPKMFSKFFRGDNVRKKEIEGTGLGMYLVKSILESSGGSISFTSEENKGTTFYVSIPVSGMKKREGTKGLS